MQRTSGTTQLLAILLIGSILGAGVVSATPFRCSVGSCASDQSTNCHCSDSRLTTCCDDHTRSQQSCCQRAGNQPRQCCEHQSSSPGACRCHKQAPQPTTPTIPAQRDNSQTSLLFLSLDRIEPCRKLATSQGTWDHKPFYQSLSSDSLSILYCAWLT